MSRDLATIMADIESGKETNPVLLMMSKRYQTAVNDAQQCQEQLKQLDAQIKSVQARFQQCVGRAQEIASIIMEEANHAPADTPVEDGNAQLALVPEPEGKGGKHVERTKT